MCVYTRVSLRNGVLGAGRGSLPWTRVSSPILTLDPRPYRRELARDTARLLDTREPLRTFLLLPGERWVCARYTVLVPLREGEAPVSLNFWECKVSPYFTYAERRVPAFASTWCAPPSGVPVSPSPCEYKVCPTSTRGAAVSESLRIRGAYVLPPKRGRFMPSVLRVRYWYAAPAPPPPSRTA